MGLQKLQLLAAPSEEEGVAALESHDAIARLSLPEQNLVDFVLGHLVMAGLLAHVDGPGAGGNQGQNGRTDQPVVDHHLGLPDGPAALAGQQARVAGTRAHQNDIADHGSSPPISRAKAAPNASAWVLGPVRVSFLTTVSSGLT